MKLLLTTIILIGMPANAAQYAVTRVSNAISISSSDSVVIMSNTGYTITLPSCDTTSDGEYHTLRNIDSGGMSSVQISGYSSDTVEGSNFFIDSGQSDTFVCDGPNHNWIGMGYW